MARREFRHCKHYDGIGRIRGESTGCALGIDLRALVGGDDFGWAIRMPCSERNRTHHECDQREFPTWEEVEEREREMDRAVEFIFLLVPRIPPTGNSGEIECPKCKGIVDWTRSDYNGHKAAQCRTDGCISFIE